MSQKCIIIAGATASGKTHLAVQLAKTLQTEIISVDSRQVFRQLDIGTGKDLEEYGEIPYHLIDIIDVNERYDLIHFLQNSQKSLYDLMGKGKVPIFCGGTPLYLHAMLLRYDFPGNKADWTEREKLNQKSLSELKSILLKESPKAQETFSEWLNPVRIIRAIEIARTKNNKQTPLFSFNDFPLLEPLILIPNWDRKVLHQRIESRLDTRLKNGMIDEVRKLHEKGVSFERLESLGLEYRYISLFLENKLEYNEMRNQLLIKIRNFARRQLIWFRRFERDGLTIHWLNEDDFEETKELAEKFLNH